MRSEFEVRLLGEEDRQEVFSYSNRMELPSVPLFGSDLLDYIERVWLVPERTDYLLFGAFREGRLRATMGIRLWYELPYWSQKMMSTDIRTVNFNLAENGLASLAERCITEMERAGRYRFYSTSQAKYHRASYGAWKKYVPLLRRYDTVVDTVIPAGTTPEYEFFSRNIEYKRHPVDCIIRSSTLKQEYRPEVVSGHRVFSD